MRRLTAAAACALALLVGAAAAPAADIGANDDSAKYAADGGAAMYAEMTAAGLGQTVIGVRFRPSEPLTIQDKVLLDRAIASAVEAGLRVVLAVYPYPPREIEAGLGSPSTFGAYVSEVARAFPKVRQFVIGNEPNQPAFWRPQFTKLGANASAAAFGPYLAAAYDALDSVDPELTVVGVGLSPRGNDKPYARNNISTSPIRFLRALGQWYRESGRSRPLMDGFSFHPYPNSATDPLERGYGWPNAGFVNVDRVKQALWDAFHGTAQPTTLNGLTLHLDEVGWQVDTSSLLGYRGAENVAVTDEITQAGIYGELVRRAMCDSDIEELSFFGFRDDGLRTGFQAALYRADGSPRPALEAVRTAIVETATGCTAEPVSWAPSEEVARARVVVESSRTGLRARVIAGEDTRVRACARARGRRMALRVIRGGTTPRSGGACLAVALAGNYPLDVAPAIAGFSRGAFQVRVEVRAEANLSRRSVILESTRYR
jgi:hypothetical protein